MSTQDMNNQVVLVTLVLPNPQEQKAMGYYAKESGQLGQQYGATIVARFAVHEQLHGKRPTAIVGIATFPDINSIKDMFASDEYQALIPYREKALKAVNLYISQPIGSVNIKIDPEKSYLLTMAVPANKEALGQYQQSVGPIAGQYDARPLANIAIAETFLGDSPAAFLSIAEFTDAEAIKDFFNDDAYQPLIPLRDEALSDLNLYIAK